jgi:hypothetical protein
VNNEGQQPPFQFSLGWLFAIVLMAALWFAVIVYGPAGSAGSAGLFIAAVAILVFDSQRPRSDAGRRCVFVIVVLMLAVSYGLMWWVVLGRFG